MKKFALIVGGGKGIRLGGEIPKQFLLLNNRPLIFHTIEKFQGIADEIVLVLPEDHFDYWSQLLVTYQPDFKVTLVPGGVSRAGSVRSGLKALTGKGIVAIHDAVRPLLSKKLIETLFSEAEKIGNAIPVIPVRESLRLRNPTSAKPVNRDDYFIAQTPQCFDLQTITDNYRADNLSTFTDDAGLFEHLGGVVHHVPGEHSNIKITYPEDLPVAEALLLAMKL